MTIAITGASGQLGQLIVHHLADRGAKDVVLGSRDPHKVDARGYRTVRADFDDAASLDALFAGADVALLISSNGDAATRHRQHRSAIDAAKRAGVKRLVFTSFTGADRDTKFPLAAGNKDAEDHLKASGLAYTILRNNQYIENLEGTLAHSKETNALFLPGVAGKVAYIGRNDLAAVTAAVLTQPGHENREYELTGGEALSIQDLAAVLTEARGKQVAAVEAPPAEFGGILGSLGLPPFLVDGLLGMYAAAADGEYAQVSPDASRILGRPVESVAGYVKRFA
jgi:NAD(P)H dehydrogenase (quinone)